VGQCKALDIPFIDILPQSLDQDFQFVVDAIFGYSFTGEIRAPFGQIIKVTFYCAFGLLSRI
jgi:NAD(P)H-hydrate epimerase